MGRSFTFCKAIVQGRPPSILTLQTFSFSFTTWAQNDPSRRIDLLTQSPREMSLKSSGESRTVLSIRFPRNNPNDRSTCAFPKPPAKFIGFSSVCLSHGSSLEPPQALNLHTPAGQPADKKRRRHVYPQKTLMSVVYAQARGGGSQHKNHERDNTNPAQSEMRPSTCEESSIGVGTTRKFTRAFSPLPQWVGHPLQVPLIANTPIKQTQSSPPLWLPPPPPH